MTLAESDSATEMGLGAEAGVLLAAEAGAAYSVKLPVFEGPLDLLLHLIRQNEVEITDIPVALISQQYLEYVELMRSLDLDVAGEYLVMAATLALIKSRMLLPPDADELDSDEIDPRAELVARLLEYQRYKEVADGLGRRRLLGRDVYAAQGAEPESIPESEREIEVDLFQLIEAFRQVLDNAETESHAHTVETELVSVRERMLVVMEALESVDSIEFHQIFESAGGETVTRQIVVATFLAILELARIRGLRVYQGVDPDGAPEGAIRLRAVEDDSTQSWRVRLAEEM